MDVGALVGEQYKVIEHIGRGGMADVWSARDTRLRRMVAIKTIASGLGQDIDPVQLFEREAQTIAQMEHPHILPIYDFGEYDNSLYIVMRYVTGGSLEEMLREGPMSSDEVLRMGEAIGQALDYAHDNNVIHLDLKPPNILLDSSVSPYLADFGLATVLDPEGRARNPGSGTLLYMAPEQIISETIDHRADIYSFCIMLFHMLTGHLPFEGMSPLAMAQLQSGKSLPDLDEYVSHLPHTLSDLLRLGTTQDPNIRPERHLDIMGQFREIIQPSGITVLADDRADNYDIELDPYNMPTESYDGEITDSGLLEAVDIYSRARYNWQGGQGRFLLGVTNFILMSEYYQNADMYNLTIDEAGYQMLLRGAIEYDHELAYWWELLDDDNRRWVCLHALRSGNTPARIRALYRLETLPDDEGTAVIPRLVAQALEVETDDTAKIAALTVLGTRVRLMKKRPNVAIKTEFRGRLITTMTRLGIEVSPQTEWQEVVYSKDVDLLVAEHAFDESDTVAEFAARTIGKMRSLTAVEHLSTEQKLGRHGSLEALAFVRDEAPALPDVVHRDARFYAWITNTVRRLTENPIQLILRFALVFMGGWIAMGDHVWSFFRVLVGSLRNQRLANTLGLGISFALLIGITYVVTVEVSRRLEGFWAWWMRLLVTGVLGFVMATISIASFRFLFMQEPANSILWDEMRFVGAGLAFALVVMPLLRLNGWQGVLLTIVAVFSPIYAIYAAYNFPQESTIVASSLISLLLGVFCGWRASQLAELEPNRLPIFQNNSFSIVLGLVLGLAWTSAVWGQYNLTFTQLADGVTFTWDNVLVFSALNVIFGLLATYWLMNISRVVFIVTSVSSFLAVAAVTGWMFFDYSFTVPLTEPAFTVTYYEGTALLPITLQPIFNYDDLSQIFKLTLPFVLVIAIGVNMPQLLSGWWQWIGAEQSRKERGAWLYSVLVYVMVITALVSVLALFSPGINLLWELSWSVWAFVTFVFALAAFRWAKWGAQGLIYSGLLLIVGGVAYDGLSMYLDAMDGRFPTLMDSVPQIVEQLAQLGVNLPLTQLHFWGIWAVLVAVFVWGAQRRALWGGIGLATMLLAWFAVEITSPIQGSISVLAVTSVALVAYALQPQYALMETSRLKLPFLQAAASPDDPPPTVILPQRAVVGAPETEIIADVANVPDPLATEAADENTLRDLDTIPFERRGVALEDMVTMSPQQLNTEDLMTQFPREVETAPLDGELNTVADGELNNFKVDLDTTNLNNDLDTVADNNEGGLTDFKINLDTSSLNKDTVVLSSENEESVLDMKIELDTVSLDETLPAEQPDSGLSDMKISLDTSALQNGSDEQTSTAKDNPASDLVFHFDSADLVNKQTVRLEQVDEDDEQTDDE